MSLLWLKSLRFESKKTLKNVGDIRHFSFTLHSALLYTCSDNHSSKNFSQSDIYLSLIPYTLGSKGEKIIPKEAVHKGTERKAWGWYRTQEGEWSNSTLGSLALHAVDPGSIPGTLVCH